MNQKEAMNDKDSNQVDILDVLIAIAKHKILIIKVVVVVAIISLIISLVWPNTYRSTTTFLPPKQSSVLPSGLGGLVGSALGGLGMSSSQLSSEATLSILKSRSLREELIHTFNLNEVYGSEIMEQLLDYVEQNTTIETMREGGFGFSPLITIDLSYDDREPERAQEIVDFYVTKLDSTIRSINKRYAEDSFTLINIRYLQNLEDLERAEIALKEFQEQYGIFEVEEQAQLMIQNIAKLKATQIELEVQINVLEQTVNTNSPELQNLIRTRDEITRQIEALIRRSDDTADNYLFFPLQDVPGLSVEYLRLYREVIIQNKVLENIYPQVQYQEMLLTTSSPSLQIVDTPNLPTYKIAPKRAFIVLGGVLFGLFASLIMVFYREAMEKGREKNSAYYHKMKEFGEQLSFRNKKVDN